MEFERSVPDENPASRLPPTGLRVLDAPSEVRRAIHISLVPKVVPRASGAIKKEIPVKARLSRVAILSASALFALSAYAQTPAPTSATSAPAAVGTSPQTAAEANQKAVPRSDTGTVVRTSPSVVDKARQSAPATAQPAETTTTSAPDTSTTRTTSRPARADRN